MSSMSIERIYRFKGDPRSFIDRILRDPEIIALYYEGVEGSAEERYLRIIKASIRFGDNEIFRGDIEVFKRLEEPLRITFHGIKGEIIDLIISFMRISGNEYIMKILCRFNERSSRPDYHALESILRYLEEQFLLYFPNEFKP
ncbi:MAG: hypothetical protein QW366_01460 [Sulfolobales archaeon]